MHLPLPESADRSPSPPQAARAHRLANWSTVGVLCLAFLIRGAILFLLRENLESDPDAYRVLAISLHERGEFALTAGQPTAFRPPLYPLLLAPLVDATGLTAARVALLHLVLGLLTLIGTGVLARTWGLSQKQQWLAIGLVALDPILLYQSTFIMTETLATLLALLVLLTLTWLTPSATCFVQRNPGAWEGEYRAVLAGGLVGLTLGLAMLCRPTFLLWIPWILLGLLRCTLVHHVRERQEKERVARRWFPYRLDGVAVRRAILAGTALFVLLALTLTPWTWRNYHRFGKPIYSTTHGGYTLWLANNPHLYEYWRTGPHERVWDAAAVDAEQARIFQEVGGDELAADREAYARAGTAIRREPGMFLYGCWDRLRQFWSPLPHRLEVPESTKQWLARWSIAVWYVLVYAMVVRGSIRLGGRWMVPPWIFGLGLVAALMLAHTFYWSNLRMRAPLVPLLAIAAALAIGPIARQDPEQE